MEFLVHVFCMNEAKMHLLQMNPVHNRIKNLQERIATKFCVPATEQVLLLKEGLCLNPEETLNIHIGETALNPVYLFFKISLEDCNNPIEKASIDDKTKENLVNKYEVFKKFLPDLPESYWKIFQHFQQFTATMELGKYPRQNYENVILDIQNHHILPASFDTVVKRTDLAGRLCKHSRRLYDECKTSLVEQSLLQQGWRAASANLDATIKSFTVTEANFQRICNQYVQIRTEFHNLIISFDHNLKMLAQIPLFPAMREFSPNGQNNSLYGWISSHNKDRRLEQISEVCLRGLKNYNSDFIQTIQSNAINNLDRVRNHPLRRRITGLSEALFLLNEELPKIEESMSMQCEQEMWIRNNMKRFVTDGDKCVLADLCATHESLLLLLKSKYHHLFQSFTTIRDSKISVCQYLHPRLYWISLAQQSLDDTNRLLLFHTTNLNRLCGHYNFIKQIHDSPALYVNAVNEVVRRRECGTGYLQLSLELSAKTLQLCEREMARRKAFRKKYGNHFLLSLFPNIADNPHPFQAPELFDNKLPKISRQDAESISQCFIDSKCAASINFNNLEVNSDDDVTSDKLKLKVTRIRKASAVEIVDSMYDSAIDITIPLFSSPLLDISSVFAAIFVIYQFDILPEVALY